MATLLPVASWACVGLITILSLLPHDIAAEVRTGLLGQIEHVIAYAGTAALFVLAYPNRARSVIVAGLAGYGGILELAQNFVPDRSPEMIGALANAAGALLGTVVGAAVVRWSVESEQL
jgi:VanZ family protein